jgi:hypothetical protein
VGCGWGSPREEREGNGWRMASRGEMGSVQGVLYLDGGHGASWHRPSRIGRLGGVVILVQWCDPKARARAVPTARRTVSVVVQRFRDTARRFRWASVLG